MLALRSRARILTQARLAAVSCHAGPHAVFSLQHGQHLHGGLRFHVDFLQGNNKIHKEGMDWVELSKLPNG